MFGAISNQICSLLTQHQHTHIHHPYPPTSNYALSHPLNCLTTSLDPNKWQIQRGEESQVEGNMFNNDHNHYVITYPFIQNDRLKLLSIHYSYNQQPPSTIEDPSMFAHTFTPQTQNHELNQLKIERKGSYYAQLHQLTQIEASNYQNILQDVFRTTFAPKYSQTYNHHDLEGSQEIYQQEIIAQSTETYSKEKPCLHLICLQNTDNIVVKEQNQAQQVCLKISYCQTHNNEEIESSRVYNTKDQTKNIPKNYIKAIFSFILDNPTFIKKMIAKNRSQLNYLPFQGFMNHIRAEKKIKRYTIQRLKGMWLDEEYGKAMRMISNYFLRKRSLGYIFGSKIDNKFSHIKHRSRIMESIKNPTDFNSIK